MGVFESGVDSLFDVRESDTFIAESDDTFSGYNKKEHFNFEWAYNGFPSGRYVIVVYQIHSLYQDGKQIWLNRHFENVTGKYSRYRSPCFAVIYDKKKDYLIPSWGRCLSTYTIHNDKNPLQVRIFTLEEAEQFAIANSENGHKVAVLEWFEDYDMF